MKMHLTLDAELLAELTERALHRNVPLEQVVNEMLRRGLTADANPPPRKSFRAKTFAMGQPLIPSLDKSLAIAAALEDLEVLEVLYSRTR